MKAHRTCIPPPICLRKVLGSHKVDLLKLTSGGVNAKITQPIERFHFELPTPHSLLPTSMYSLLCR